MKFRNLIVAIFLFLSSISFSQTSFSSIDSLLFKVFETLNLNDSSKYISLVNQKALFSDKKVYSKKDSLMIMQPFYDSYSNFRASIDDMVSGNDFTIGYLEFKTTSGKEIDNSVKGKISLKVKLVVNETFSITCPFIVNVGKDGFTSENPLMPMFLEN